MRWKNHHSVLSVLFLGYLLCYMDRMVIATALPFIAKELQLSSFAMGGVMSAFFVGYALMQIPGGLLADRFGPTLVLTTAIIGWSIFTFMTGLAGSLAALIIIRVLFGMAEGPYPPSASKALAMWFTHEDIGKANGIQLASVNIGAALAPILVAPWVLLWGWRSVFYVLLLPGLALALAVWLTSRKPVAPQPAAHAATSEQSTLRLAQIVKVPTLVWCSVALFFGNIAGWGLMNWLPTYLLQARGFHLLKTGVYASVPFLAGALGYYLSGLLSDKYFNRRRHVPIVLGFLVSGGITFGAAVAPSGELAVAALTVVFLFFFMSLSGLFTYPLLVVAPQAVGRAFGVVNTVAQVAAFVSPLIIGYILDTSGNDFSLVFYLLVGLFLVAACAAMNISWRAQVGVDERSPQGAGSLRD